MRDEGGASEPAPHHGRERHQESPGQVEVKVRVPIPGRGAEQYHGNGHHRRGPHPQLQGGQAPGTASNSGPKLSPEEYDLKTPHLDTIFFSHTPYLSFCV